MVKLLIYVDIIDYHYRHPSIKSYQITEESLEVKLPTISTDGKAEMGKSEKKREEERRSEQRKSEEKSTCARRQERRKTLRFSMICGPRGSKSILAKAAGAEPEPSGGMRHEKLHAIVARSRF